jgi:hypothetical protein
MAFTGLLVDPTDDGSVLITASINIGDEESLCTTTIDDDNEAVEAETEATAEDDSFDGGLGNNGDVVIGDDANIVAGDSGIDLVNDGDDSVIENGDAFNTASLGGNTWLDDDDDVEDEDDDSIDDETNVETTVVAVDEADDDDDDGLTLESVNNGARGMVAERVRRDDVDNDDNNDASDIPTPTD